LVTPALGTPSALVGTNITGTAAGLTAGTVTTNANLTGDVTSVGNATTLTNAAVIAKVLTGYTSGAGTVAATDNILQAVQKLNGNDALKAPLASPTFTGTPVLPTGTTGITQTAADNSTKLATTAYADAAAGAAVTGKQNTLTNSAGLAGALADETGTGLAVFATSPTLTTPVIGVATATTVNKVAITAPATGSTLTIAEGKTLTASNSLTLAGTDASTLNIGTGGTLGSNAYTSTAFAPLVSPTFTGTPTLPTGTIATTQAALNSTTAVATTAFVTTADNLKANLASPTFTGTPTLPTGTIATTQAALNSTTAVATTAFVTTADNLKANLASPTFTGTPTLPTGTIAVTQAAANNSTAVATTAYADAAALAAMPAGAVAGNTPYWSGTAWVANSSNIWNAGGNVGIGMDPIGAQKLQVAGKVKSNGINETSDERWKMDIKTVENALPKVLAMRGVNYNWRTQEFPDKNFDTGLQLGLIAQEVEKVIPEVVDTDDKGFKSVEYSKLVALLLEAIKEQQKQIAKQQADIAALKSDNKRIDKMEEELAQFKALLQNMIKNNVSAQNEIFK
jgi:hypothetical protein